MPDLEGRKKGGREGGEVVGYQLSCEKGLPMQYREISV